MIFTLLAAATLTASSIASAAASNPSNPALAAPSQREALQAQIAVWAQTLASAPGFQSFGAAKIELMPLGPGTHGWLVLLKSITDDAEVVGYMVVHAQENGGYQLSEYGLGEYPLFAEQTLRQGLARLELLAQHDKKPLQVERLYPNAMLAAWRITDSKASLADAIYLDAKTGEQLPIDDADWAAQLQALESADAYDSPRLIHLVSTVVAPESFDPYARMPWLTREPLAARGPADVAAKLQAGAELRFVSEWFNEQHLYVLPLAAMHQWNDGTAYAAVDQDGLRFLPYSFLARYAQLYD